MNPMKPGLTYNIYFRAKDVPGMRTFLTPHPIFCCKDSAPRAQTEKVVWLLSTGDSSVGDTGQRQSPEAQPARPLQPLVSPDSGAVTT